MPKKNILFALLIFFIGISIWFLYSLPDKRSTIIEDNNFAIEDTSIIEKIFIADRSGNTITVKKNDGSWVVNNKYEVRQDAINTLLSTISKLKIKKPVSKSSFDNVIKFMATSGIKVEIYDKYNLIKSYTIGSNTSDHLGTYMLMKSATKPFVIHIPSFNGFLSPRYGIQGQKLDVVNWRSNKIFSLKSEEIENIKFTDLSNIKNSYQLSTNPLILSDYTSKKVTVNKEAIFKLLNSFQKLNCETYKVKWKIDFSTQLHELIVNSDTLRTYQLSEGKEKSKEENFTVDRMYATVNHGDLMLIQDYVFNKVLITLNELKK